MGMNYNLLVIKLKTSEKSEAKEIITSITKEYSILKENVPHDAVMNFSSTSNLEYFAFTNYKGHIIVSDEIRCITKKIIESIDKFESILRTEIQSTVDTQLVEYWEDNSLKRKYSLGMNSHLEEMAEFLDDIPKEVMEKMKAENEEIGDEQWFEKNGKSTYEILKTYGIDKFDILDLNEWNLLVKNESST